MIAFTRIDSRLIHGQVIEGWLDRLKVARILVADDSAATTPLTRAAMTLAVPPPCVTVILPPAQIDFVAEQRAPERTLLLFREPDTALEAIARGLVTPVINLGNIHYMPGRLALTPSVFLTQFEAARLEALEAQGQKIDVRALPHEQPIPFHTLVSRMGTASP